MENIFDTSEKLLIKIRGNAHISCHVLLSALKGTAVTLPEVIFITSETFLVTRLSPVDPSARLDNLSNLSVGRLVGLQHSSVIIYHVVIVFGQIRHQFLRECVIILKCENSFIVRFN